MAAAFAVLATMTAALPAEARRPAAAITVADDTRAAVARIERDVDLPDSIGDPAGYIAERGLPPASAAVAEDAQPASAQRRAGFVVRVPVLMYHYISEVPSDQSKNAVAVDLRVPPALFEQHLAYLKEAGYTSVSAPQLWDALNGRGPLLSKPIELTFDDGYADAYTNALPLLQRYGFRGTFFITVNLVGKPGYLTWEQVTALDQAGMDIESHAMDHRPMSSFSMSGLAYEMGEARASLARRLGHDVRFFAYPSGDYNATALEGAAAFGYDGAFLKSGGAAQSVDWRFMLRRTRVSGGATVDALKAALSRS